MKCKKVSKLVLSSRTQKSLKESKVEKSKGELKAPVVLEALAASGLRAIRYACEVDGIGKVLAIDNDKASIEICKKNIQLNGPATCSKVAAYLGDARVYMLTHPKEFDAVDLDPYGSPSVFLDSTVQTVADGGLLMCTATDLAVLCGEDGDVCYSKYGSYPLKGKYCHEMALRILLACIEELSDVPLFLSLHNLCGTLRCTTPSSAAFQSGVIDAGYRISGTHISPLGFKSDAPMHVIWDIMRCWVKNHPVKSQPTGEAGTIILAKEPTLLVNLTQAASTINKTRAKKAARFLPNPERSWGPKLRAGRLIKAKHASLLGESAIQRKSTDNK